VSEEPNMTPREPGFYESLNTLWRGASWGRRLKGRRVLMGRRGGKGRWDGDLGRGYGKNGTSF
jgi:hypothetical protein